MILLTSEKRITDILLYSLVLVRKPHCNATFDRFLESHEEILAFIIVLPLLNSTILGLISFPLTCLSMSFHNSFSISLWQMPHFSMSIHRYSTTCTDEQRRKVKAPKKTLMIHSRMYTSLKMQTKNRILAKSDCHIHFRASWLSQLASQTICSYNQVLKNDRHCNFIAILIFKKNCI